MADNGAPRSRIEHDSMGPIAVPQDRYWGAQTQRSVELFRIGTERMPPGLIRAFGVQKKAAALANMALGLLETRLGEAIVRASDEVIANRANQILGNPLGSQSPVHPNDHVNMCQSSNDSFPTAIHIAGVAAIQDALLPGLRR